MDYIGSKEKVNKWMFDNMSKHCVTQDTVFLDACSGSGSVSRYAASLGCKKIIANDIMEFPSHIVRGSLCTFPKDTDNTRAMDLIARMNALPGTDGFFAKEYCELATPEPRLYVSVDNARKLDACRAFIEKEVTDNPILRSYLLWCLVEAMSSVSNTTGVQAAFLKKLKDRARNPVVIKSQSRQSQFVDVEVYAEDILKLLKDPTFRKKNNEDLLYIDPPYNERQYGPNYHLYETLVKNDNPTIRGKTGLREWTSESKSLFCSKKTCLEFTQQVVESTTASQVFISYNSDGLLNKDEIICAFPKGTVTLYQMDQKRFKSDSSEDREYNVSPLKEYLFRIVK